MHEILQYLKTSGEKLDTEIAEAMGIPLAKTRLYLAELTAKREVMFCHAIRFVDGKKIEGESYRLAGFIPKAKPGAKSKVQLKLS
ncbi:MAG: ArsR family transcriptional regulator [Gallionellaceae bacterium]|jgi:hypothetical protein